MGAGLEGVRLGELGTGAVRDAGVGSGAAGWLVAEDLTSGGRAARAVGDGGAGGAGGDCAARKKAVENKVARIVFTAC